MIKFDVKNHLTGKVQFTAEIDAKETDSTSVKLGLAVRWAVKNNISLVGANMEGANMEGAYMRGANMEGAYMRGANMEGANMEGANMKGANMEGAINAPNIFSFGPIGKEWRTAYAYEHEGKVNIRLGCFNDTTSAAIKKVSEKYGAKSEYVAAIKLAEKVIKARMK